MQVLQKIERNSALVHITLLSAINIIFITYFSDLKVYKIDIKMS